MTPTKYRSWVISLLRRGTMRWPPRNECLKEAKTERRINFVTGRLAQHYRCAGCKEEFPLSQVCIDHIEPVVPAEGFSTWDNYITRMFCPKSNLQVLCKLCHDVKTKLEKGKRNGNNRIS